MPDVISSTQNPRVRQALNLQKNPRARRAERKIVLEGVRLIRDAFERGNVPDFVLYDLKTADYDLIAKLQETHAALLPASAEIIKHISDTQQPQGMIGVFPLPVPPVPKMPSRVLILDAIREPGNMGTILRTATAAGVQITLLASDCVDPYNPKVLRSGMGAHFRMPVLETTWGEITSYCQDMTFYIADSRGDVPYTTADWQVRWALIIGNEARGIGERAKQLQAQRVVIPMAADTESLNAAVATGVILFEASRQILP